MKKTSRLRCFPRHRRVKTTLRIVGDFFETVYKIVIVVVIVDVKIPVKMIVKTAFRHRIIDSLFCF